MSLNMINHPLPDWHLEAIDNQPLPHLMDFKGRPLVILLFYLGCPGCMGRAIPFANNLVYKYGDQISVMGIHSNFEGPDYDDEEIQEMLKELYVRFPVYKDQGVATTFHDYQAGGTPHWILVDSKGIVYKSIFGSAPDRALLWLDYALQELI